jgi:Peptidase family M28
MKVLSSLLLAPLLLAAPPLYDTYREPAQKLIEAALSDDGGYEKLSWLCDRVGNRLSGSENLNRAIAWAAATMRKDGLVNVTTPEVTVPHWVRGRERLTMVAPVERGLPMLGLGDSVGTPAGGITAPVVLVSSFDQLERLGREGVQGKIVLYNVPFVNYGITVRYRTAGPSRAARLGAVAALVRSVTPVSLQTPHTGMLEYQADAPRIPAAAVTIEGALLIQRLVDAHSTVIVHLEMGAQMLPDARSSNVIGEIRGRELPDEVVVMGGHLDSWDVGEGAQDDGSGVVSAMEAAALIQKLGLRPRRTLRVVLWTNEENGGAGGRAYREWVGDAVHKHFAAIEMDGGAEKPIGFAVSDRLYAEASEIDRLLEPIGAATTLRGGGGADIAPLMEEGVPGLALLTAATHYFDWHHTAADTVDKVNPADLRQCIAAMAVMSYVLADMPGPDSAR